MANIENIGGDLYTDTNGGTSQPVWNGIVLSGADLTAVGVLGTNPAAKLYPDGSVVGSSDYGTFTKYANGDLTCSLRKSATPGGLSRTYIWNFPLVFVTALDYSVAWYFMEGSTGIGSFNSSDANINTYNYQCSLNGYVSTDNGVSYVSAIATGRWK